MRNVIFSLLAVVFAAVGLAVLALPALAAGGVLEAGVDLGTLWAMLEPMLLPILGLVATALLGRFVSTEKDKARAVLLDTIADSTLAMIRLNNPGNALVERIQVYEDKLFEALMADKATTYNATVLKRAAASAIGRALDAAGTPLEDVKR